MRLFEMIEPGKKQPIDVPGPLGQLINKVEGLKDRKAELSAEIVALSDEYKEFREENPSLDDPDVDWSKEDADKVKFYTTKIADLKQERDAVEDQLYKFDEEKGVKTAEIYDKMLLRDCSEFLQISNSTGHALYRGLGGSNRERQAKYPDSFQSAPVESRYTKDTGKLMQTVVDTVLKKSGFDTLRGNSIFTTSNMGMAREYGKVYMIFPKNGFKYTWSTKYRDFFEDYAMNTNSSLDFLGDLEGIQIPSVKVKVAQLKKDMGTLLQYLQQELNNNPSDDLVRYYQQLTMYLKQFLPELGEGDEYKITLFTNRVEAMLLDIKFQINDVTVTSFIDKVNHSLWNLTQITEQDVAAVLDSLSATQAAAIADYHGFTNTGIEEALEAGHEILLRGEYYAFEQNKFTAHPYRLKWYKYFL